MPCYSPLRGVVTTPQGRISVPCGRCIGCRVESARQHAVRISHESKMHDESVFITLTYDPEHVPVIGSLRLKADVFNLSIRDVQLFMKRLRQRVPGRIRFFLCGEYGEDFGRPHYHAIIFGYGVPDRVPLPRRGEFVECTSPLLSEIWGKGNVHVGSVSFDSAMYVANYATKKITGKRSEVFYAGRQPEFLLMSRRPGIGASWIDKFRGDVFPSDEVIVNGFPCRPPRYYDKRALLLCLASSARVINSRRESAMKLEDFVVCDRVVGVAPGNNARRLVVRETVAKAKLLLKSRRLDNA